MSKQKPRQGPRQGPLWDAEGVLDSDLLLKWGCAGVGLLGLLAAILGFPCGLYGAPAPPPENYLLLALAVGLGFGGVYVAKARALGRGAAAVEAPPSLPELDPGPAGAGYPEDQ